MQENISEKDRIKRDTTEGNAKENRMFREMRKAALQRLRDRNPELIASCSGIPFDSDHSLFHLNSLGNEIRVHFPDFRTEGTEDEWHELVLLHYMDMADGTPLTGQLIPFGELPQGMIRGGGFDRDSERTLGEIFGEISAGVAEEICRKLGAEIIPSKADFSARFFFFPHYPVTMNIWLPDEEFPGTGKLLLDSSAGHYLSVEDSVTAGELLLRRLERGL